MASIEISRPPTDMSIIHWLPESKAVLTDDKIKINDGRYDYNTLGVQRVRDAIDGVYNITGPEPEGIISYVMGYLICKKANNNALIAKYAYNEMERTQAICKHDPRQLTKVFKLLCNMVPDKKEERLVYDAEKQCDIKRVVWGMPVPSYLGLLAYHGRTDQTWKLVNRDVRHGHVYMSVTDWRRVSKNAIVNYIQSRIREVKSIPDDIIVPDWIRQRYKPYKPSTNYVDPPCIKNIQELLHNGQNVPHSGRVLLASYCIKTGKTDDDIQQMFVNGPKYNPQTTRKQIEFTRKRGYMPANCDKIKQSGLCCADCGITSPLQYRGGKV